MAIENTAAIRFEALTEGFKKGVDEATKALRGFEASANGAGKAAKKAEVNFLSILKQSRTLGDVVKNSASAIANLSPATAAASAAVGILGFTFVKTIKDATALADSFNAVSKRTGFAIETLSQLKFVAEQNESSFEALQGGLRFLNRNIGQAAQGGKEAQEAFKRLGVSIADSSGKLRSSEDILNRVSDGLKNTRSVALRTSLALAIFGRGSQSLVPLLSQGSEAIAKQRQEADALGATISTKFARQADDFGDNLGKLRTISQGLGIQLAQAVVPAFNQLLVSILPIIQQAIPLLTEGLSNVTFGFSKVVAGIRALSAVAFGLVNGLLGNKEAVEVADEELLKQINILTQSKRAFEAMTNATLKNIPATETNTQETIKQVSALQSLVDILDPIAKELEGGAGAAIKLGQNLLEIGSPKSLKQFDDLLVRLTEMAAKGNEAAQRAARGLTGLEGPQIPEEIAAERRVVGPQIPEEFLEARRIGREAAEFVGPELPENLERARDAFGDIVLVGEQAQTIFQGASNFADQFGDALFRAAEGAEGAFGDFFKKLLKDLARAIIRATILQAILGAFGLGGKNPLSFVNILQKALGVGGGGGLGFPQREEAAIAGQAQIARGFGTVETATAAATQNLAPQINVQVFEPGPLTKIILTDTVVIPRLRQRLRQLGEESFTR